MGIIGVAYSTTPLILKRGGNKMDLQKCPYCKKEFEAPDNELVYYCSEDCAKADSLTEEELGDD